MSKIKNEERRAQRQKLSSATQKKKKSGQIDLVRETERISVISTQDFTSKGEELTVSVTTRYRQATKWKNTRQVKKKRTG